MSHEKFLWALLAVLCVAMTASATTLDVSIESSVGNAYVGDTVEFEVWLRNIQGTGSSIQSLELDFGAVDPGLAFVAGPDVADGFGENDAPIPSELDTILDGSLLDGHTAGLPDLSYVAFASSGITATSPDRLVGSFWVQAAAVGTYTLSTDHSSTSILTGDLVEYTKNYIDAPLTVTQPGDFNGDGQVDSPDLTLLLSNWGVGEEGNPAYPAPEGWTSNWDGFVDSNDLTALLINWGAGLDYPQSLNTAALSSIPEPATLTLLALSGVLVGKRRKSA